MIKNYNNYYYQPISTSCKEKNNTLPQVHKVLGQLHLLYLLGADLFWQLRFCKPENKNKID